ncbi:MAG TPA: cysteine desulfurase family protein [Rubricoccaceae bacterium]|jgi:cysteine desulfurase
MPYLDHAATSPLRDEAFAAMEPWLRAPAANASSFHGPGRRARVAVDAARERVAAVLGCEPGEVVFTSGGTEADNAAVRGTLTGAALRETGRPGLVTSAAEHHAVLAPARALAAEGHPVAILRPAPTGAVDVESVAAAVTPETGLVSVLFVNNEVGTVTDVRAVAQVAHAGGAFCHTDAVQAAGLFSLDVGALGVDLLTITAHKVGGPVGAGALFVRTGTPFAPMVLGGAQERGRRGGTENVAAIVGFAEALSLAEAERVAHASRLGVLQHRLATRLRDALGDGLRFNTPLAGFAETPAKPSPHILSVSLRPTPAGPLDGQMLLVGLDLDGVHVSAGSACTSGALEPSGVLLAMGVDRDTAAATVRFSLGRPTTDADVDAAADAFVRVAGRMTAALASL